MVSLHVNALLKQSDPESPPEYLALSRYTPRQAARLLDRLAESGIAFQATQRPPRDEAAGPTIDIDVSVEAGRASEAAQIHRELFGDEVPNYDSSFFRERRNV